MEPGGSMEHTQGLIIIVIVLRILNELMCGPQLAGEPHQSTRML